MTSDGFSIKTTISQLANVARTQAKGQTAQPATPVMDKLLKQEKRLDRIKHNEEVQKQKVDPDRKREQDQAKDREPPSDLQDNPDAAQEQRNTSDEVEDLGKGVMLDTKA